MKVETEIQCRFMIGVEEAQHHGPLIDIRQHRGSASLRPCWDCSGFTYDLIGRRQRGNSEAADSTLHTPISDSACAVGRPNGREA